MDFLKLPAWAGFLSLILIGVLMLVHGAADPLGVNLDAANKAGFITFGLCAIIVGVVSWVAGATSKIKGREGTVGVKVAIGDLPWWAWVADVATVVLAVVIFMVAK